MRRSQVSHAGSSHLKNSAKTYFQGVTPEWCLPAAGRTSHPGITRAARTSGALLQPPAPTLPSWLETCCHRFDNCGQEPPRESLLQLLQGCRDGRGAGRHAGIDLERQGGDAFLWEERHMAHSQPKWTSRECPQHFIREHRRHQRHM